MDVIDIASGTLAQGAASFHCPGERHPIARSVHLARLEAGYAACAACLHRHETGVSPRVRQHFHRHRDRNPHTLVARNGLRGVYHNDLTRSVMERLGGVVAAILWDQRPRRGLRIRARRRRMLGEAPAQGLRQGPRVAVGQDDRFSSADLALGLVRALRRAGCAVVDLGVVHRPLLDFAVDHVHADAGLMVTGGGTPSEWNGLDIVGPGGVSWSADGGLRDIQNRMSLPVPRPTRTVGPYRVLSLTEIYTASLRHHFHALRPLRIGAVTACRTTRDVLETLSPRLPCQMRCLDAPVPFGENPHPPESVVDLLADLLRREHLDVGVLVSSDGRGCFVMDDQGELMPGDVMIEGLLRTQERATGAAVPVVVPPHLAGRSQRWEYRAAHGESEEALRRSQRAIPDSMATDGGGRYWLADTSPACDAVLTMARMLQFFSLADRPVSSYRQ